MDMRHAETRSGEYQVNVFAQSTLGTEDLASCIGLLSLGQCSGRTLG